MNDHLMEGSQEVIPKYRVDSTPLQSSSLPVQEGGQHVEAAGVDIGVQVEIKMPDSCLAVIVVPSESVVLGPFVINAKTHHVIQETEGGILVPVEVVVQHRASGCWNKVGVGTMNGSV